ncbi:hypothetical protein IW140_000328 [Coemansia sp. RSA 1813]|nr:hypothetical protein EV178_000529 [Coemansia sp. RSA 1646]KAJ1773705.1 hypothetical protein LPJ74_000247 [Coemansia sp. RSA 1843]KAJ2093666.1 hypothetical protein IW138_000060 [Coemansia sp. RSA 986]KAJ2217878.1 hypothetical protein EV179_000021 [Coemansia sp. RSA 487]KAJ2573283.1 hypothetical protein IW140_000328 [Coemansia sp. RSA 1813]
MRIAELTSIYLLVGGLLVALASGSEQQAAAVSQTLDVFDNRKASKFMQRGELQLLTDGTAQYHSIGVQQPPQLPLSKVFFEPTTDPALYTVIVQPQNNASARFILPIKRCRLSTDAKKLEETFVVHQTEKGDVFHVDYDAGKSENCVRKQEGRQSDKEPVVFTRVLVSRQAQGPMPKLAAAANIDMSTGKEVQPEPSKSFLAKYWYYLIPIVLLLMLGGEEPQQEGNNRRQ